MIKAQNRKSLGELLAFDKRFNGVPKEQQGEVVHFNHVSADDLKSLLEDDGDVRLISTGLFDGYTTKERAGHNLNFGEIITIPSGGAANIKYYNGYFVDSGNIIGVAKQKDETNVRYVYWGMIHKKEEINSLFRGASIKHPYMPDICKITIPFPSLEKQNKVVEELDSLSRILEKKQQQIKELDKLCHSVFYDMFGDPSINEKCLPVVKMSDICNRIADGVHSKPNYTTEGVPFISVVNINTGKLLFDDCKYVSQDDYVFMTRKTKPEKGDVLYTKVGATYGIPALVDTDKEFCLYVSVCLLKVKKELVCPLFLKEQMSLPYIKRQADDRISGIGVPDLHLNQIGKFDVLLPPIERQNEFARKIMAIDEQKERIKNSIKETEVLFRSRMAYYFEN